MDVGPNQTSHGQQQQQQRWISPRTGCVTLNPCLSWNFLLPLLASLAPPTPLPVLGTETADGPRSWSWSYAAFHWARKLVFPNSYKCPSRKSGCSQNSEFPTRKYYFRLQRNVISNWETRKCEFPSPMECSICLGLILTFGLASNTAVPEKAPLCDMIMLKCNIKHPYFSCNKCRNGAKRNCVMNSASPNFDTVN